MKIERVVCAVGRNGYIHKDLMAIKAGARANGFLYEGPTVLPGFDTVVQTGAVLSIMLVLEDGSVAHGDCVDVIFAGAAGRDPVFRPAEHLAIFEREVAPRLVGRDVARFRALADEMDALAVDGRRLHTAVRYGISQALLHAAAIAGRRLMAEVVADEYGTTIARRPVPILMSVPKTDWALLDRMIIKRVDLLPHGSFTVVDVDLGRDGGKLLDFAAALTKRIKEVGAPDYRPRIHLDTYGTLGELFADDAVAIVDFLGRVRDAVAPFDLLIESPVIARTMDAQIAIYRAMRERLRATGSPVRLIVDEWCNTLDDIRRFGEAGAADMVQIKAPDLGGMGNSIEAVLYCRGIGMGCCLGGTANETDQSARITTHVGLACGPDFLLSKPGLGGDEALMIQGNEMARTLALLAAGGRA
ncbi:MAG: methylaspartate ammonia-lyase [Alphaproteobacteria bacterium]